MGKISLPRTVQCTKIRSDAAEIKKDSYLEQSKIRKDNGIMINTAPNKINIHK